MPSITHEIVFWFQYGTRRGGTKYSLTEMNRRTGGYTLEVGPAEREERTGKGGIRSGQGAGPDFFHPSRCGQRRGAAPTEKNGAQRAEAEHQVGFLGLGGEVTTSPGRSSCQYVPFR